MQLRTQVLDGYRDAIRQAGEESVTVEKMTLDAKGMAQPTGEFETLEVDAVILAVNFATERRLVTSAMVIPARWASFAASPSRTLNALISFPSLT